MWPRGWGHFETFEIKVGDIIQYEKDKMDEKVDRRGEIEQRTVSVSSVWCCLGDDKVGLTLSTVEIGLAIMRGARIVITVF